MMDRNKAEVYKPGRADSVNGRGQIGLDTHPWAEIWAANIYHISQAGAHYTATGDITLTDSKASIAIYTVNPNGADRNVTPSGTFRDRALIIIFNVGSDYSVRFNSSGLNGRILPGKVGIFTYNSTTTIWIRGLF